LFHVIVSVLILFLSDLYKEGGKAFYDPSDFPWTKMLEDNWLTIRDEFNALQQRNLVLFSFSSFFSSVVVGVECVSF
jgi:hypothetical protein